MKIAVICGGISPEREVSLSTGAQVAKALRQSGNSVALIDSASDFPDDYEKLFTSESGEFTASIHECAPDLDALKARREFFGRNVLNILKSADIVFNAMHGAAGEDGTLQGALDLMGIKYTGSGMRGCSMSMDKTVAKRMLAHVDGVSMPNGIDIERTDYNADPEKQISRIMRRIGLPLVVKPACGGSSVGVSIVKDEDSLVPALELALGYEEKIVIEEFVDGREFSAGVLGDMALPPIEIRPKSGFYDYKNKYQQGMTDEICPADIPADAADTMMHAALIIHRELGLSAYSRSDFKMTEDGRIYALEANTLPGMTPVSLIPQEAAAVGIDFKTLCKIIIDESMKKYD